MFTCYLNKCIFKKSGTKPLKMKLCYNSIIRTTCDWNKTSPFPSSVFWLPCQRHTIDTDFMANNLLLQAMENNYGYSRVMKQQVEVWQRGSVNFKHRCATRKPVFIHTRKPGAWQPRETLSCHLSTLILAWRQDLGQSFLRHAKCPCNHQ